MPAHLIDSVTMGGLRETDDVDVVIGTSTYLEFARIEAELRKRGFGQPSDAPHLARWTMGDLKFDIVSAGSLREGAWVRPTPSSVRQIVLSGVDVPVLALPYLLAAKIEAFRDPRRAFHGDFIASRDMEDIVVLLEGADVEGAFALCEAGVGSCVGAFCAELASRADLSDILECHVTRSKDVPERVMRVARRITRLAAASR